MIYLLASSVGIFSVSYFPALPSIEFYLVILTGLAGFGWATHNLHWCARDTLSQISVRYLLCLVLGIGWGVISAHQYLAHQLPATMDKQTFVVQGSVVGLVDKNDRRLRFELAVDSVRSTESSHPEFLDNTPALERLLLSWYLQKPGSWEVLERHIESGDRWQLMVRLRRPRGMLNPGGFDYQAWLIQNGFSATGYIIESPLNQQLIPKQHSGLPCS
jgi:competence protein ComEC